MLSTETRLTLENIAYRISVGEEVSLSERALIQKWADHNKSVYEMLRKAQREFFSKGSDQTWVDDLLTGLNIGDPDPSNHRNGFNDLDDLTDFFKAPNWTRRD